MSGLRLHHVSIVVRNLEVSRAFYRDLFGLADLPRPPFKTAGVWLASGDLQVHLIVHPGGTFRQNPAIDGDDVHFAFNTADFEGFMQRLAERGFSEAAAAGDPKNLLVRRQGLAGFPQVYLLDPDHNIIEVNGAP